jgi:putative ABC transport system substrate-binding protein
MIFTAWFPAIYAFREFRDAGGLVSYRANNAWTYWRAASYIGKIFKGANPADLSIEQPTKFELIINLKTAKALGNAIPNMLLPAARDCCAAGGKFIVSRSPERRASGPRLS